MAVSCGETEDLGNDRPQACNVDGKVEKGPFVSGSTITMQPMNARMQASGEIYTTAIQDDFGNFTFGSQLFDAPFADLTANGYFFNEVSGKLSSGTINLRAAVELSDRSTIHVNILTHLKYQRVLHLAAEGKTFKEANIQAQKELFAAFGLSEYAQTDASLFSIAGGNDEAAALIAVSSLLLADRTEAELTEYLAMLCREFGQNGKFSAGTEEQIKEDREKLASRLSDIKNNIVNRYEALGRKVEVKELVRFFDWDGNGIAGDETLKEGETVSIETERIEIPNEGGSYRIKITSPVPVYLEPLVSGSDGPVISVGPEQYLDELYKEIQNQNISIEKQLEDGMLVIDIAPLNSRIEKTAAVSIYDCLGNVLGTVELVQAGNENAPLPLLGKDAENYMDSMASTFARGLSEYCMLEQYYHYNREARLAEQYITPDCSPIFSCWNAFYQFNGMNLTLKHIDAQQAGVWQNLFDVFSAMQYYYMTTAWGGVPYITDYDSYLNVNSDIARTGIERILYDLQGCLKQAIPMLDEKRNESLENSNRLFFMSKDVARFLLANICMNQQDYGQAAVLLQDIIKNGFYELDGSDYSSEDTINEISDDKGGKEILFALRTDDGTRAAARSTVRIPAVIPLQTYTDVVLSYAECLYKQGDQAGAERELRNVAEAKNIPVSDNVWEGIVETRMRLLLYCNSNFAFMKRNGLAAEAYDVEEFRLLWPIPQSELFLNPNLTQNPGY